MITKTYAIIFILLSGLASFALANIGIDTGNMEMAAIANLFGPPLIGITTLVLFLLLDWLIPRGRLVILILFIIANLATGIIIRLSS
jgi:hypothetical protein